MWFRRRGRVSPYHPVGSAKPRPLHPGAIKLVVVARQRCRLQLRSLTRSSDGGGGSPGRPAAAVLRPRGPATRTRAVPSVLHPGFPALVRRLHPGAVGPLRAGEVGRLELLPRARSWSYLLGLRPAPGQQGEHAGRGEGCLPRPPDRHPGPLGPGGTLPQGGHRVGFSLCLGPVQSVPGHLNRSRCGHFHEIPRGVFWGAEGVARAVRGAEAPLPGPRHRCSTQAADDPPTP